MKIRNIYLRALLLSLFVSAGFSANMALAQVSDYYLQEITESTPMGDISINIYNYYSVSTELSVSSYNLIFNEPLGSSNGNSSYYYKWVQNENGCTQLVAASAEDYDLICKADTSDQSESLSYYGTPEANGICPDVLDPDMSFAGPSLDYNFIGQSVSTEGMETVPTWISGGAILNNAYFLNPITGDFVNNYCESTTATYAQGGAIANIADSPSPYWGEGYGGGLIVSISSNFIGNYVSSLQSSGHSAQGGAIFNNRAGAGSGGNIGSITGEFIANAALGYNNAEGGAIYIDRGEIGDISALFLANYSYSANQAAGGGAIYNNRGTLGDITGDFIANYAMSVGDKYTGSSYGGALYNGSTIGDITGNFIQNYVYSENDWSDSTGGAIWNTGTIGVINGEFMGNYAISASGDVMGGAIRTSGTISDIVGNFVDNYVTSNSNGAGGAIYSTGTLASVTGDFINNYAYVTGAGHVATAGAIYMDGGSIGDVKGNFVENHAWSTDSSALAGAIYIKDATIAQISGDFIRNYALSEGTNGSSEGGAIYASGTAAQIHLIEGNFIDNYAKGRSAYGGAIFSHHASFDSMIGDFINNVAISTVGYARGGAIYNNWGSFGSITGDFIGNNIQSNSSYYTQGGAIYNNHGTFSSITGSFLGNYALAEVEDGAAGGAIYNENEGVINIATNEKDIEFTGNYVINQGVKTSNAIYNNNATINLNAYQDKSIIINDGIDGDTRNLESNYNNIININNLDTGNGFSTVEFNNTVEYNTINVCNGTLKLGEYEGGTIILSGVDSNSDGIDDSMSVAASSALLSNCFLNIEADATVNTKADYLGSSSTIINNGILNITGGTLSQSIAGAGTINLFENVTTSSTMTVASDATLNNYGTLTGNLSVAEGTDVNAIITTDNLGETIFDGSITGINSMDVSFDLTLDFNDVVGTTTTIYANESDAITLTLVDSDHISGASVVGNTVVVEDKIEITTDDYTATVTKEGDSTNIDVTAGSFEIAEGETQTLSGITTGEDATLVISGGTLVTDNNLALANDDATSGVKADSGVIESTATVELSEGTISVASGSTLEIKAELNLADDTQATFGSSDASLVLQKDITLGENSVLTLDGNISGSANIIGNGTATINYTGVFSPGNSPELVSYTDTTVNYMGGSILEMEIFGEAGAGVDGGHDKIVFYGCNVSFDGTIQLNIDDVASLMGEEQSKTITIDLFDFEGGTSIVSFDADFDLVYDSDGWFVIADTSNLLTTGEVSLSITAIPEPSTATLSLIALAGMLARRRRKAA